MSSIYASPWRFWNQQDSLRQSARPINFTGCQRQGECEDIEAKTHELSNQQTDGMLRSFHEITSQQWGHLPVKFILRQGQCRYQRKSDK